MSQQHKPDFEQSAEFDRANTSPGAPRMDHQAPNAEARAFAIWGERQPGLGAEGAPLDDLDLDAAIIGAATGDRIRFSQLFQYVAPKVKAYLMLRGVAPAVAEALAVETMIEVWRGARSFDPSAQSGYAWIFQRLRDVDRDGVSPPRARL